MFSLGLQPYPMIGISEIGDYIKSGKVLDKPQLSSDEMYIIIVCYKLIYMHICIYMYTLMFKYFRFFSIGTTKSEKL